MNRYENMSEAADGQYHWLHRYTVVAVETQGLSNSEAIAVLTTYGKAVHADRTYTAVAGEESGTGYLVATELDAFDFAERMRGQKVRKFKVCFHGYLHNYFSNPRGVPDEADRVANAARTIKLFRTRNQLEG